MPFIVIDAPLSAGLKNQTAVSKELTKGGFEVELLVSVDRQKFLPFADEKIDLSEIKCSYLEDFVASDEDILPSGADEKLAAQIIEILDHRPSQVFTALRTNYEATLRRLATYFADRRPDAVIVADDGVASNILLLAMAKCLKVPVLCCPYGNGTYQDLENSISHRISIGRAFDTTEKGSKLVAEHYPKWLKTGNNSGQLMVRPEVILARETLGVTLENCWRIYGSNADVMCVVGNEYKNRLIESGFPADRIRVTGSPSGSEISKAASRQNLISHSFRKPQRVNAEGLNFLVSCPPNYHASRTEHISTDKSYVEQILEIVEPIIQEKSAELTVLLHPKTAQADIDDLVNAGIKVSNRDIFECFVEADVFITDFSSTIEWAIGCGIPVINYDFYNFDLDIYGAVSSVKTIAVYEEYVSEVERLISDEKYYRELATEQCRVAGDWIRLDVDFAEDIRALLN